jgi:hypothetical protein
MGPRRELKDAGQPKHYLAIPLLFEMVVQKVISRAAATVQGWCLKAIWEGLGICFGFLG